MTEIYKEEEEDNDDKILVLVQDDDIEMANRSIREMREVG